MADEPIPGDERSDAGSIQDRAANGEQEELFPEGFIEGDKKTLANVMKRGLPVELVATMMQGEVPMRDGIPDPEKLGRLAVTVEPSNAKLSYVREKQPDGQRKIVGYKIAAQLRPVFVENLGMGEDAMTKSFEQLLAIDAQRAGKHLDALQETFSEYMRTGQRPAA
jgi:hypothetical protein